jgi:hypothetical protein
MIKIAIPNKYREELTYPLVKKICDLSLGGNFEYEIEVESRSGRHIIVYNENLKRYICISNSKIAGRNSFLCQYLGTTYTQFVLDDFENKDIQVYILESASQVGQVARYHHFINKVAKTLGIKFINESETLGFVEQPFANLDEFIDFRNELRGTNSANYSTYFLDEGPYISFYGKVYGANGKESVLLCHALKKVAEKQIKFFAVEDNEHDQISGPDETALELVGITIESNILKIEPSDLPTYLNEENEIRNQALFHFNLLNKFGDKKCYICNCNIESAIIGAHIHRVADIKRSSLGYAEKVREAIDQDNGFWLCGTHDKLFEMGIIYFYGQILKYDDNLATSQIRYLEDITKYKQILDQHYTEKTANYINKHLHRIGQLAN